MSKSSSSNKLCRHYFITGKVQGVWFRDSTRKEATKQGVNGWVRNLPDGRVEAMICGTQDQLQIMHEWLQAGPELAEVTHIEVADQPCENIPDFSIR